MSKVTNLQLTDEQVSVLKTIGVRFFTYEHANGKVETYISKAYWEGINNDLRRGIGRILADE